MIAWLWKWVVGNFYMCRHRWDIIGTTQVMESEWSKVPLYRKHTMQCRHCGELKKFSV